MSLSEQAREWERLAHDFDHLAAEDVRAADLTDIAKCWAALAVLFEMVANISEAYEKHLRIEHGRNPSDQEAPR